MVKSHESSSIIHVIFAHHALNGHLDEVPHISLSTLPAYQVVT